MARKKKPIIDPRFANAMFFVGLVSSVSNMLRFFDLIQFSDQLFFISIIILGVAFFFEGSVVATLRAIRDGLTNDEIVHITTLILGLFLVVIGSSALVTGSIAVIFNPILGFVFGLSIIFALVQRYVVRQ